MLISNYFSHSLATCTGVLLGWTFKSTQQANPLQEIGPDVSWNHNAFSQLITNAHTYQHIHPSFLAKAEHAYYNLSATCTVAVEQAKAETNECGAKRIECVDAVHALAAKLRKAQLDMQTCHDGLNVLQQNYAVCKQQSDEARDDLKGWAAVEQQKAEYVAKYVQRVSR